LNGLFFLLAKTRPGEGGGRPPNAEEASDALPAPARTMRMLDGIVRSDVGIAGRTFMLVCGELRFAGGTLDDVEPATETEGEAREAEEVELALEWVWW
jgi:hypothetical protein